MKAAKGRFWREKDNTLCKLQCCRSEMMSSWHDAEKLHATTLQLVMTQRERMGSSVFMNSVSEVAVRLARGHTRERQQERKSEMGVTLEIIHGWVTT